MGGAESPLFNELVQALTRVNVTQHSGPCSLEESMLWDCSQKQKPLVEQKIHRGGCVIQVKSHRNLVHLVHKNALPGGELGMGEAPGA